MICMCAVRLENMHISCRVQAASKGPGWYLERIPTHMKAEWISDNHRYTHK